MDLILGLVAKCCPCFPDLSSPYVWLNNTKYKIVRLLGEGGFSYVYLVSSGSNSVYALKRIRCPFSSSDEVFKNAMKEVKNYHRFAAAKSAYLIQSIEESVVTESDGSRTVYILLPYFEKSLQDIINFNVLNSKTMDEEEILTIFVGICRGIQVMHKHKRLGRTNNDVEEDDLLLPMDSDDEDNSSATGTELMELSPYAHRDIKPANVMLSAEGLPVLVDFGSCSKARLSIKNRQQALTLTDFASEHCTLPYRAPELLDVDSNAEITESTDIWSLGCVLYACCFGFSPFERMEIDQGANLNVAIASGRFTYPANHAYSPELIELINSCLQLDSTQRPQIDDLIETTLGLTRR